MEMRSLKKVIFRTGLMAVLLGYVPGYGAFPDGCVSVAVICGRSSLFGEVAADLKNELGSGYCLWTQYNDPAVTADSLAVALKRNRTDIAVLMDNRSISLFREFQQLASDSSRTIPSVSCLGVSIHQAVKDLRNAAGVSYEVPVVTAAAGLRAIMNGSITRVGIIHRDLMTGFIDQNIPFCVQEKIEIVPYMIPASGKKCAGKVRKGLKYLLGDKKVDALWVPNDIALLEPVTIRDVWIPLIRKYRIPVIVGIEKLADPELGLGTFAVLPDPRAISIQVAGLIVAAQENGWRFTDTQVEFPISVIKILNRRQALNVRGGVKRNTDSIDRIWE